MCELLIINLTLRVLTCWSPHYSYSMPVGVPKPGFHVPVGKYSIRGWYVDAITTYKGQRVNVGRKVICLNNRSCLHEFPNNPSTVGTAVTHGCFRVHSIDKLFRDTFPNTVVYIIKEQ